MNRKYKRGISMKKSLILALLFLTVLSLETKDKITSKQETGIKSTLINKKSKKNQPMVDQNKLNKEIVLDNRSKEVSAEEDKTITKAQQQQLLELDQTFSSNAPDQLDTTLNDIHASEGREINPNYSLSDTGQ